LRPAALAAAVHAKTSVPWADRGFTVILGLSLALASALGTNLSSLFKARGAPLARPVQIRHPVRSAADLFRSRWFAIGWILALFAWALHVEALALAPLSSVQAILSGGLVFLAVLAERFFGFHLGRRQWGGVALTAAGLAVIGLTATSEGPQRSSLAALIAVESAILALGLGLVRISTRRDIEDRAVRLEQLRIAGKDPRALLPGLIASSASAPERIRTSELRFRTMPL
jgi:drug/metabolite transporter (DMT)-like permease